MKSFIKLTSAFFYGEDKKYARFMGLLLIILSQILVGFSYLLTRWNNDFFKALGDKNLHAFYKQSLIYCIIVILRILIASLNRYYGQQYALRWRIWMTSKALDYWLIARINIEGSDQRIQEDLMRFTNIFEKFFLECINSIILICVFIPMLYSLSSNLTIYNINLSNVLVTSIIVYTILGLYISTKIANPLIKLEYDNQKIEANFRYHLVHARDGQDIKKSFFDNIMVELTTNYNKMYALKKNFSIWQRTYDEISYFLPFLLIGTNYFSGAISLGMLMQIRSTFGRIRKAMSYVLDNYAELTELSAISIRLVEFYESINFITKQQNLITKPLHN
jgi:putative ATP-binding cassette transporter